MPCCDIDFFIVAILIFLLPRYQFFNRRDTDNSSPRYRFFLAPPPGANLKHRAAPGANFSIAPRRARISASRHAGHKFQRRAARDANFSIAPLTGYLPFRRPIGRCRRYVSVCHSFWPARYLIAAPQFFVWPAQSLIAAPQFFFWPARSSIAAPQVFILAGAILDCRAASFLLAGTILDCRAAIFQEASAILDCRAAISQVAVATRRLPGRKFSFGRRDP